MDSEKLNPKPIFFIFTLPLSRPAVNAAVFPCTPTTLMFSVAALTLCVCVCVFVCVCVCVCPSLSLSLSVSLPASLSLSLCMLRRTCPSTALHPNMGA